jgi:hypothetical protein
MNQKLPDKGSRRSGGDRRAFSYAIHIRTEMRRRPQKWFR